MVSLGPRKKPAVLVPLFMPKTEQREREAGYVGGEGGNGEQGQRRKSGGRGMGGSRQRLRWGEGGDSRCGPRAWQRSGGAAEGASWEMSVERRAGPQPLGSGGKAIGFGSERGQKPPWDREQNGDTS